MAGGVTQMVHALVKAATEFSEEVTVIAPKGSVLTLTSDNIQLLEVAGVFARHAYDGGTEQSEHIADVLQGMLEEARKMAGEGDVIISLAYDYPAFSAAGLYPDTPLLHYVTMALEDSETKQAITTLATDCPAHVAFMSAAQAAFFIGNRQANILPMGIEFAAYALNLVPKPILCWAGRISPEKDVGFAMHVAHTLHLPLRVIGAVQDDVYWESCKSAYPAVQLEHMGFMETNTFQHVLGEASVFLMTSSWLEAFGIVVLEAQACGVPVVCYEGTGAAEIVRHGITGYVVKRMDRQGFIQATRDAMQLRRESCRNDVQKRLDFGVFKQNLQAWVQRAFTARYR